MLPEKIKLQGRHSMGHGRKTIFPGIRLGSTQEGQQAQFVTNMVGALSSRAGREARLPVETNHTLRLIAAKKPGRVQKNTLIGKDIETKQLLVVGRGLVDVNRLWDCRS